MNDELSNHPLHLYLLVPNSTKIELEGLVFILVDSIFESGKTKGKRVDLDELNDGRHYNFRIDVNMDGGVGSLFYHNKTFAELIGIPFLLKHMKEGIGYMSDVTAA